MPKSLDQEKDMKQSNQAKDEREVEELDRKVRTYKKQLEKLVESKGSANAIRDTKSRLALSEKKLAEKKEALAKANAAAEATAQANKKGELTVAQIDSIKKNDLTSLVEEAFLRTLSRQPTTSELETSRKSVALAETPIQGLNDLLWALINSKEFILNH